MPKFVCALFFILCIAAHPASAGESGRQPDVTAVVVRVLDGDSLVVDIPDFPPIVGRNIGIRVAGCDAPEMRDPNPEIRQRALLAKALVESLAPPGSTVVLRNIHRDKYFRLLCTVDTPQGDLTATLLASGLALPYDGGKKPQHASGASPMGGGPEAFTSSAVDASLSDDLALALGSQLLPFPTEALFPPAPSMRSYNTSAAGNQQ